MKRICAWCGLVLDAGEPGNDDVSHGICPECLIVWRAEAQAAIEKLKKEEKHNEIQHSILNP